MKRLRLPLATALACLQAGSAAAQQHFADESDAYGVLFVDDGGSYSWQMGSGAGWIDFDADGDEDLFLVQAGGDNRLLRREGASFVDAGLSADIAIAGERDATGLIVGDVDQDGWPDVYVVTTKENALFVNGQGVGFVDRAVPLGVAGDAWTSGASFADFDLDGDLDLYVGNYIRTLNFPYHYGEPNSLFVNQGPGVTPAFIDRAQELGVSNEGVFGPSNPAFPEFVSPEGEPTAGCTLSTCTLDVDEDGRPDIQVGNDFGEWVIPNRLYKNLSTAGTLAFADVTERTAFDTRPHYNMGINPVDFDHDGDWDFYLTNLGDNVLLRNDDGLFVDATVQLGPVEGLSADGLDLLTSWGTVWGDVDNDTWEDLIVVNGFIPAAPFIANALRQPNALWLSQAGQSFVRVPDGLSGLGDEGVGRAAAPIDVDSDGLLDFYATNNQGTATALPGDASRLYVNQGVGAAGNHWLELKLKGRCSNLEAIGARVDAHVQTTGGATGTTVLKRQLRADPVYMASPTRTLHFGLGTAPEVDRLIVHWPSGIEQTRIRLAADAVHALLEPEVTVTAIGKPQLQAGVVSIGITVENHQPFPVEARVLVRFEPQGRGTPQEERVTALLDPGEGTVTVSGPIRPGALAGIDDFAVLVRVVSAGGVDEELRLFARP
ncbi:MAG: CRTAC1 family protein [Planctomycetota bacterium]|nr:CRTAC1 family protein [Planctomycetota bacterium]